MVKIWPFVTAAIITVLIAMIGHPLWLSLEASWEYADTLIWSLGITFMCVAGILFYFKRYSFFQYLFGLWGYTWFVLFFFQVFPAFSISLL